MIYPGKRIVLRPGQHAVSSERITFHTLLGSCVAACLWDESTGVVGMNHFLLANQSDARDLHVCHSEAGKYGVHAMELVINGMLKLGAQRHRIKAKVFGGASLLWPHQNDSFFRVGEVNCRFILEFLRTDGIPLVASDLGGNIARIVHFMSDDFAVHVRKIKKIARYRIAEKEHTFWRRSIDAQEGETGAPELWL
jgi:chemotaxis protein CheD